MTIWTVDPVVTSCLQLENRCAFCSCCFLKVLKDNGVVVYLDIPMTTTGVPSPPVDVTAVVTSLRFITLSWRQPNTSGLSDIIGYFVRWKENGSNRCSSCFVFLSSQGCKDN